MKLRKKKKKECEVFDRAKITSSFSDAAALPRHTHTHTNKWTLGVGAT